MRKDIVRFSSSVAVGLGLFSVYLAFLEKYVSLASWANLSQIEVAILSTQLLRVIIVFTLGKKLKIRPFVAIIIFSFEAFLIPVLVTMALLTGDPVYAYLIVSVLTTWIGVSALVLSPFAIYEFAKSMLTNSTLSGVIIVATLEMAGMLFIASIIYNTNTVIPGFVALGSMLIMIGNSQVFTNGFANLNNGTLTTLGLLIFFIGLMVYLALGAYMTDSKIRFPYAFVLPFVGTLAAVVWSYAFLQIDSNLIFVLTIPTVITAVAIWVSARGR